MAVQKNHWGLTTYARTLSSSCWVKINRTSAGASLNRRWSSLETLIKSTVRGIYSHQLINFHSQHCRMAADTLSLIDVLSVRAHTHHRPGQQHSLTQYTVWQEDGDMSLCVSSARMDRIIITLLSFPRWTSWSPTHPHTPHIHTCRSTLLQVVSLYYSWNATQM